MKDKGKEKKLNYNLIFIFVVVLIGLIIGAIYFLTSKTGGKVRVSVDGELYGTYSLTENRIVEIKSAYGDNTLEIRDGKANMCSGNCPDGLCVRMRAIDKNGQSIICLPNKVVVDVVSDEETSIDGQTGGGYE